MAKLLGTSKVKVSSSKITKREMILNELAELLAESFEQDVKATKEGLVFTFENEKGETKDFVFKVVEKKDRIHVEDFLE